MPNSQLQEYIETARTKNISDEIIKSKLVGSGWSDNEVNQALLPETSTPLPPPPVPRFGMWVAFEYIILFICLYISFTAMAGILDHGVNKIFPDQLDQTSISSYSTQDDFWLKGDIAAIVVAFPIFAILFLLLNKQVLAKPAVRNLRARKILIYITLVGTFLIMIGHLIGTIYNFLGGTTTMRSFGHLLITFVVAGAVFVYLIFEVTEDRKQT